MGKPLHVQVAEALGCKVGMKPGFDDWKTPLCGCEDVRHAHPSGVIFHYDTDWSATGPLIEKYGLGLAAGSASTVPPSRRKAYLLYDGWDPVYEDWVTGEGGATELIAVCHLVLALREAGKLAPE